MPAQVRQRAADSRVRVRVRAPHPREVLGLKVAPSQDALDGDERVAAGLGRREGARALADEHADG
jgi:hypothetical protein